MPSGFYNKIRPINIKRSTFNLSHTKQFACDMGQLIPLVCIDVVPNDIVSLRNNLVIRTIPLVSPTLTEISAYVHYFFVPNRLLMKDGEGTWQDFITGGLTGDSKPSLPCYRTATGSAHITSNGVTVVKPISGSPAVNIYARYSDGLPTGTRKYSLWDYFGFPTSTDPSNSWLDSDSAPLAFPFRAYNQIMNDWYIDPLLQTTKRDLDTGAVMYRNMKKDYFISALTSPFLGAGTSIEPFLGFAGTISGEGYVGVNVAFSGTTYLGASAPQLTGSGQNITGGSGNVTISQSSVSAASIADALSVDSVGYNVNELRVLYATQRFLERCMVSGSQLRYGDFLMAHFGVSPRDEVLQRAEYIGGFKSPIVISEVAQTSQSTTSGTDASPQGTLAGNGLGLASRSVTTYRVKEFGIIMGIISIMPDQIYYGGISRSWLRRVKEDYLFPEFSELGAQPVFTQEICALPTNSLGTSGIFGYQGRYDEYRTAPSIVCAGMTDEYYKGWNNARLFLTNPSLNSEFISGKWLSTTAGKKMFSVQEDDTITDDATRCFIVNSENIIKAVRPLPYYPIA